MNKVICRRWAVDLSTCSFTGFQLANAVAAVQPEERDRLMKFVFAEDFFASLVGRLLMRKFVSESTGIAYHQILLERDSHGKPYLNVEKTSPEREIRPISFNISHQGDLVVLAGLMADEITGDSHNSHIFGVGVDVMKIEYSGGKPLAEFFRLMKNKFSPNEWRYINYDCHSEYDKLKAFMRHWCLKESYVKELGVGITIDLQDISFKVDPKEVLDINMPPLIGTTLRCNDVEMTDWHFEEHLLQKNYCAAIAFKNCQPVVNYFHNLNISDLLVNSSKAEAAEIQGYCENVLKKPSKKEGQT